MTKFVVYDADAYDHPEEYEDEDRSFAHAVADDPEWALTCALDNLVEGHIGIIMDSAKHLAQMECEETLEGAPKHDFDADPVYRDGEYVVVREEP